MLTFGQGEWQNSLVIELYDKGNVLLLDPNNQILTLLRNSKHDADSRLTTGDTYNMIARQEVTSLSVDALSSAMQSADPSQTAMKLLMKLLPLGKEAAEHTLLTAKWPGNSKMSSRPWEDGELLDRLVAATEDAQKLLANVETTPGGVIVLKQQQPAAASGAEAEAPAGRDGAPSTYLSKMNEGSSYEDFAPFEMAQHHERQLKHFSSFSEAVDEFFSLLEVSKAEAEHAAQEASAWKKVDKIKNSQESQVERLRSKEQEDMAKASLIETHAAEIDDLLALLRNSKTTGMDWTELQELIEDAAKEEMSWRRWSTS